MHMVLSIPYVATEIQQKSEKSSYENKTYGDCSHLVTFHHNFQLNFLEVRHQLILIDLSELEKKIKVSQTLCFAVVGQSVRFND